MRSQERFTFGQADSQHFQIDLVLRHRNERRAGMALDTKYKTPHAPSIDDVSQVVAYAEALDCTDVALVYPVTLKPLPDRKCVTHFGGNSKREEFSGRSRGYT